MDLKRLLGLGDGIKRIYNISDQEVDQEEYQITATYLHILFMEKGLVDTIGPTWEMIHDPRYGILESKFVSVMPGPSGGMIRVGQLIQNADGLFQDSNAVNTDLEQIAEILDEGRHLMKRLQSNAILEAAAQLWPDRAFRTGGEYPGQILLEPYTEKTVSFLKATLIDAGAEPTSLAADIFERTLDALAVADCPEAQVFREQGILSPKEKKDLKALADSLQAEKNYLNPNKMHLWPDYQIFKLIKEDYPNWFSRKGEPNSKAKTMLELVRGDLVGLVADYAEVPKFQETMLIMDEDVLYDPEIHSDENPRCSAEYLWLQRALDYRAQARVVAVRYMRQLGLDTFTDPIELTDEEADHLLVRLFRHKWDTPRTEVVQDVMNFFFGILATKKSVTVRQAEQLAAASEKSKAYIAKLKSGEVQPVTRETDGIADSTVHGDGAGQDVLYQRILQNPNWAEVFSKLQQLDKQYAYLHKRLLSIHPGDRDWQDYLEKWEANVAEEAFLVVNPPVELTDEIKGLMESFSKIIKAQEVLEPVFDTPDFVLTDDATADMMAQVNTLVPAADVTIDTEGKYGGQAISENSFKA